MNSEIQTDNAVRIVQNTSNQTLKLTHLAASESTWPCNKETIEDLFLHSRKLGEKCKNLEHNQIK